MRQAFIDELVHLAEHLAGMCDDVATALERASRSLLDADLPLAEQVIDGDPAIDRQRDEADEAATTLLVLQSPMASDLRLVISAIHLASDLERMGDLALHVAQAVRRRHPEHVLPDELTPSFAQMGRAGVALARSAATVIRTRDLDLAARMERDDDALDDLHQQLFRVLGDPGWPHGVGPAVDATLLARFHERYGDHAVSVARRVTYIVSGRLPHAV